MRRFATPLRGITDLGIVLIALNAFLFWFSKFIGQRPEMAGLDFLLWLAAPAAFCALYLSLGRIWPSAGLMPKLKGQGAWFVFGLTLPMALSGVLLLVNQVFGVVSLDPDLMASGVLIALASLAGLFVKNIVEEFIFRGFLTGRFAHTVSAGLQGHLLTGVLWSLWHLVYWTALLPVGKIAEVSGLPMPLFVIVGCVALCLQSILLGELRLITGSIWAGVVLHTMNNAIFAWLVAAQAVPHGNLKAILLTPIDLGLIYSGLMALIGVALWRRRLSGK